MIVGGDGHPTEVGVRVTGSAMNGLPTADMGRPLALGFPAEGADVVFDHVMLNWNPHGHDPVTLYGRPHFDFHFDMVDHAAIDTITPADPNFGVKAAHLPDPKYVPQDYVIPRVPPVAVQAVPGMGLQDGRYIFMEPMITRAWLLTKPDLPQEPIKQPRAYQRTAYYPTTFAVHFDDRTNEYVIALGGLTMRTAS